MGNKASIRDYVERITTAVIPIDLIQPHEQNYNFHPEAQLSDLEESYKRRGQFLPKLVWKRPGGRYTLVIGEGFTAGARRGGADAIRCEVLPEDTPEEYVREILLADNLHARNSVPDETILARLLKEQQMAGVSLASLGSDEEELRQLLEMAGESFGEGEGYGAGSEEGEEDELPEIADPRCKPGDIWQLGRHRIACLDAFDPATYKALLGGVMPHAIINDPPYGMRLDADYSAMVNSLGIIQASGLRKGNTYADVIGDNQDFDASALANYFPHVKEQFWFGADYYSHTLDDTMHTGSWLVWDKRLEESADKMFGSCFELIWSKQKHKRDILRHKWAGVFGLEHEPVHKRQHPTQKPVRLLEDIITRYTEEGCVILDSFLGSGTTLISAQRTGRACYGCELSPAYIDVIIARWEQETGEVAHLVEQVQVQESVSLT